ncbi:prolipoprotein diacylglyceryl transferase [Paracoccus aurantiacus]|uniref:Phosphatidylglycerol--prolipoprotein diacylglyceryl transferase n=1 Tax=Paracoccus aurantiacus TaxID=2599412 RepID=A0A5C6S248_9RHOB|nr:prolipoprotein diacylglyceryl transferase [Paracoccus aurantiacus]TXB68525.1 prolipoprotein diacylglyceryl transferase [Paracoccus aurantiacus]
MIPFPDISPVIFTIPVGEGLPIRWYAVAYLVGLVLGAWAVWKLMKSDRIWGDGAPMRPDQVEDLLTWIIGGVIIGGRLGFVLFYEPQLYLADPLAILKVWQGGMSFHGGFTGVVIAAWLWARRNAVAPLRLADALAVAAPIGLFFGRIANFINAELWGRPTDLPWGVIFPGDAAQTCPGITGSCARHPSQLYEAALEGLLLGLVLFLLVRRGGLRRPGLLLGVFLAGYACARIFVEFFRVADAQFITADNPLGRVALGMSMGQLLSLPMLALGIFFIFRAIRLPAR